MLSPGTYHLKVPKNHRENLAFRRWLLQRASQSRRVREGLIDACRNDILLFINAFVWQYNPTIQGLDAVGPFVSWDFQDAALLDRPETTGKRGILWCYENDRSAVVEKSREMGASWLFLIFQDWLCMFRDRVKTLNISRSANAVDSKSPDSLFWKLRFIHEHLPDWLRGDIVEQDMYIGFERTRSTITGEASTGRAGVGGRAGVIFVDEFSQIKEATEVRQRTANTANCRFFNGTHVGRNTEFAKLTKTPEFVKIQIHWTQHPEKKKGAYRYRPDHALPEVLDKQFEYAPDFNYVLDGLPKGGPFPGVRSPWYDKKCAEIGSRTAVAEELDIDILGSVAQFFDGDIRGLQRTYCVDPYWEGEIAYDRDTGRPLELVKVAGGPLKLWMHPTSDGRFPVAQYAAGADISTGAGATNSILSACHCHTGEKVLEYATPDLKPDDFALAVVALCWLMKNDRGEPALLAWEIPGPGLGFGKRLLETGYRHIYWRNDEQKFGAVQKAERPGWSSNPQSKLQLLQDYRADLVNHHFVNRSEIALEECLEFKFNKEGRVEHGGEASDDPTGARENHGDRVIADALANKMRRSLGKVVAEVIQAEENPVGSLGWRRLLHEQGERRRTAWV